METVSNIASAASKAIWGEQPSTTQTNETAGTEPVSGVKGRGDLNEPFDKGNETTNTTSLPDRTADKMSSNTSDTFGSSNTQASDSSGPHDSSLANKADPRIDSKHAGSYGNTSVGGLTGNSTGGGLSSNDRSSHTGGGLTSNTDTFGSDSSGPHQTSTANKLDPRVDSEQSGSFGNTTGSGLTGNNPSSHTSGGLTGSSHSHTHGSDSIGSQGNTTTGGLSGNSHSDHTTGGLPGSTHSHGSASNGPHDSSLSNKVDPRVDSERSQGNFGSHSTPSSIPTNPISGSDRGVQPHQETDKTGVIGGHSDPFKTSQNTASESKSNTGAPTPGAGHTKQQGAANPTEEPSAEDFLKTKDPSDRSGEPMHMHTGAGDDSAIPKTQEERRESKVGNPGGQEHGRESAEGTGEQWVKTSGMAADGGDFDATKPGAGREADRLMEQKGIHKSTPGKPSEPLAESSTHGSHGSHGSHGHDTEGKEKVPITQKIKEKLHIGSKHE